jgi:hypothetical protein
VARYTEHPSPDTNAAKFWLMNRQRHLCREKQAVERIGSIEAQLRAMTPGQRHVRLIELQAKVDAAVAGNRIMRARTSRSRTRMQITNERNPQMVELKRVRARSVASGIEFRLQLPVLHEGANGHWRSHTVL